MKLKTTIYINKTKNSKVYVKRISLTTVLDVFFLISDATIDEAPGLLSNLYDATEHHLLINCHFLKSSKIHQSGHGDEIVRSKS